MDIAYGLLRVFKSFLEFFLESYFFGLVFCFGAQLFTCYHLAKYGFKLNKHNGEIDNTKKENSLYNFLFNKSRKTALIPFVNLIKPFGFIMLILQSDTQDLLHSYYSNDHITPLTLEEIEQIKDKPNIITSYKINLAPENARRNLGLSYCENGIHNIMLYDILDKDYIITKTEGPISLSPDVEQRAKFISYICAIAKYNIDNQNTIEPKIDDMKNLPVSEQKKLLFWFRNYMLEQDEDTKDESERINVFVRKK